MRVRDALEQLDQIHEHLTKTEVYRGFRVRGVAVVGVVGLVAATVQQPVPGPDPLTGFVAYWVVVACVCGLLGFAAAGHAYFVREDEYARRRTRRVLAQFLPSVLAGGLVTAAAVRSSGVLVGYLPGLWAVVFGLGMISARPYLPKGVGLVGLGYVTIGGALLARAAADREPDLSGWSVGGVFGAGHLLTAFVLWCDRTRDTDG
ncbi:MAG: hypothetical protein JWO38_8331 [Gemmataceae bacterium]|nr:hypothetical protein [Gemmataceae bacterium]